MPGIKIGKVILALILCGCPCLVQANSPFSEEAITISLDNGGAKDEILITQTETECAECAEFPCEGTVNCSNRQNVRVTPGGKIIDGFLPGTKVEIVEREGLWYKIRYGDGFAYLHVSLVDTPMLPASDGVNPSPYEKYSGFSNDPELPAAKPTTVSPAAGTSGNNPGNAINGPEIPESLVKGLAAAKKSTWFTTKDKCLQFAGTVAAEAGANVSKAASIYPHTAYKPDKTLRGSRISSLDEAALEGRLKPGMLIHVKAAYDKDPAYNPVENAHHWFVYMGLKDGVPMFADCLREGRLQTIEEMDRNMSAGRILKEQYKPYGNIRRVSAVYDPFADQR